MMRLAMAALLVYTTVAFAHDPAAEWEGDAAFAEKTRMHHQMGIKMNVHCQQKAIHDELKQFCTKSAEDQQQDLAKLNAIAPTQAGDHANRSSGQGAVDISGSHNSHANDNKGKHKGKDDKRKMHAQGMQMMGMMDNMSGEKFEQMFLMHNSKHHQQMIDMAKSCEQNTQNAELKSFCSELRQNQAAEKQELERFQSQWYPNMKEKKRGATSQPR